MTVLFSYNTYYTIILDLPTSPNTPQNSPTITSCSYSSISFGLPTSLDSWYRTMAVYKNNNDNGVFEMNFPRVDS